MRRRRWMMFPVLLLAVSLVAAGCGDDDDEETTDTTASGQSQAPPSFAAGTTMATIQSKGKIVIGVKFDQPGFGQRNPTNNQVEGFDVEIGKLIAVGLFGGSVDDISSKIEFKEAISRNREPFIQNGDVDIVIATYTINDTRKQVVDFAGPYFIAHQDIMVKSSDNSIRSVNDLNGKQVCSVKGSTSETNVKQKAPNVSVLALDDYSKCTEALTDGRVVAVTTDAPILGGYVAQSAGAFKLVKAPFTDEPYGIGLKKGDEAFRAFLNDRLEAIYADGSWAQAFTATLGKLALDLPTPPPVDRYTSSGTAPATTASGATTTTTVASTTTTRA